MKTKMATRSDAPHVTDHALLRFLQRSGVDVEAVRGAIASSLTLAHQAALSLGGPDHLIVVDDLGFVVRGGNVTTVLPAETPQQRFFALKNGPRG